MVEKGSFRRDLYYRLNALPALIPPLRERGDDILLLLDHYRCETGGSFELSDEVRQTFLHYRWPGNIRELRNVAEYLSFTGEAVVHLDSLPPTFHRTLAQEKNRSRYTEPPLGAGTIKNPTAVNPVASYPATGDPVVSASQSAPHQDFWFVLEQLYLASEQHALIGRECILAAARQQHLPLSQKEVRTILSQMAESGLVKVGRGRGGSRLTPAGRELWERQSKTLY